MRATQVLQSQLQGINAFLHEIVADLTDEEWTSRTAPGTNLLGYTLWHMPRCQDCAVQTVIRGVPEVIDAVPWSALGGPRSNGIGVRITFAEADQIARSAARSDVTAYADAVHQALCAWLDTIGDDDLDTIPDVATRVAPYAAYRSPDFQAEIAGLVGRPVAEWIISPCIEHLRDHLSEANLLKTMMRASV